MLFRVSCKACRLTSIWTDDPAAFVQSVCLRYRHCEAKLQAEGYTLRLGPRPEAGHAPKGRRRGTVKTAALRSARNPS